jgi:anti-sigma-K factor RskA
VNCEEFRAGYLAAEESDHPSPQHLETCAACRASIEELDRLRTILQDPLLWETPAPDLEDRVVGAIVGAIAVQPAGTKEPSNSGRSRIVAIAAAVILAIAISGSAFLNRDSPDWSVTVPATVEAASAVALADGWNTEAGTRIRFTISGLDLAPSDSYYEIWLTADDGRHISGGTFRDSGTIDSWIAVSRKEFPRIWITLEPTDDDLGPSSVVVFDTKTS